MNFSVFLSSDSSQQCLSSLDCEYLFSCNAQQQCIHNDVFGMNWIQILSYLLIIIIIGISTVGGLGGGIEKVPVLMVMLNYSQKTATYYTYPLMLGANLFNLFLLIPQRHPKLNRPIIDYDIALILLPTTLLGSALGVMLNQVLPDIMLLISFIFLMTALVPGLIIKANAQRQRELRRTTISSMEILLADSPERQTDFNQEVGDQAGKSQQVDLLQEYLKFEKNDSKFIPLKRFLLIVIMFLLIEFIILIRGGQEHQIIQEIGYCSDCKFSQLFLVYWVVSSFIVLLLIAMTIGSKLIISREQQKKINCHYLSDVEVFYNWSNYMKIWGAGMAGGVLGGMLGIGSGSVMVPMLILFNVNSRVAAATSGFSKLLIAGSSVMLGYLQGELNSKDILFYMGLALIGGLFISTTIYYLINRFRQQSFIIYIVAGFLVINILSAVLYIIKESLIFGRWQELTYSYSYCQ